MTKLIWVAVLVAGATACTKQNALFCSSDADCTSDPLLNFCDVDGDFQASGHTANTCIAKPSDCSIERCGCTPNTVLSCDVDQLTACNADGKATTTSTCNLGCADETRCSSFEPSNGLGDALTDAASQMDIVLPGGSSIDTDTGLITNAGGDHFDVKTVLVVQSGGPSIRVFEATSFTIDGAVVTGSLPLAFVASGTIEVGGLVDASAQGVSDGPGGQDSGDCVGSSTKQALCGFNHDIPCSNGGGGGGNATSGGAGGITSVTSITPGGVQLAGTSPLIGGCRGGTILDSSGAVLRSGGGGGGAVQLVAGARVELTASGVVNLGGGGGLSNAGGGSAGTLVVEAPVVQVTAGTGVSIAANGGAAGACTAAGADGDVNASPALAPASCPTFGGNGGTSLVAPADGALCAAGTVCNNNAVLNGGGGGASGRTTISTKTGEVEVNGTPSFSVVLAKTQLVLK